MQFREATPEERKIYYNEEWGGKRDLPDYVLHSLSMREFGFDHDGSGPNDRKNQFLTVDQLESYLRTKAPYSAYVSVAQYEEPSLMKGWLRAELAFDVDAKDLPAKRCCGQGQVCESCLEEARRVICMIGDVLRSDLGLRELRYSYSGRGFHLRVLDEAVQRLGSTARNEIVSYVVGCVLPADLSLALGYPRVFRSYAARILGRLDERTLQAEGIRRAAKILEHRDKIISSLESGRVEGLRELEGIGEQTLQSLLEVLRKLNSEQEDGRVTVDVRRILRLPSSLHSGVSMKCVEIRDIERFTLDQAVPKFVGERVGG
ncbi:MAG: DNA primase catalytic subunit PriS [Candidatus Hadarchaeales archaeon]